MPLLPVTFPDVQLLVVDYLRPLLGSTPIGVRVPNPRPPRFVTLRRVGGPRTAVVEIARVDLLAWAKTDQDAHDLVQEVRRHLTAAPGIRVGSGVRGIDEFSGPVTVPDESDQPRWMVTYEFTLRGSSA